MEQYIGGKMKELISWKEIGKMQRDEQMNDKNSRAKCPDCGALVVGGTPLENNQGIEVMTGFVCEECGREFTE